MGAILSFINASTTRRCHEFSYSTGPGLVIGNARPGGGADQIAAVPGSSRQPDRFHVWGRFVDGSGGRRDGDAADRASRHGTVREVLAGRKVDRLYGAVRRR